VEELSLQKMEPNLLEKAIIEWDVSSLKKYLTDQNLLFQLGYSQKEIDKMHVIFFGIKIPNPSKMNYFEKAVYYNDKKTIQTYYEYMTKNKDVMDKFGYTKEDLARIHFVHIKGNPIITTSQTDSYEIASRLFLFQNNKNRMQEMYILKYLKESPDLSHKNEALNSLLKIYKEEEYLPERLNDIKRLLNLYPEMLEFSQLARSLQIELLYRDQSDEGRYKKICELGYFYEKKPEGFSQKDKVSKLSYEEEKKTYTLETKAKYFYAISLVKCNEEKAWEYFKDSKLYEQTNVSYMKEFLEASRLLLKFGLSYPGTRDEFSPVLHAMAEKAKNPKAGANYGFLLYLNREFGDEFGISKTDLEELYKKALDDTASPFACNGYGTYLYALAQEYIRDNNTMDGFVYKKEFLQLKRDFYSYFSKHIEKNLLEESFDSETIRYKINNINKCILTGERKLLNKDNYNKKGTMPRFLCFFPEQEPELSEKYEKELMNNLEEARQSNTSKYMLQHLKLSMLPDLLNELDDNAKEKLDELRFYVWKTIQYNFENSKDQWLILAKIYEYYMRYYKRLEEKERDAELKNEYKENRLMFLSKIATALRVRAELNFEYDDWYDLYQFYFKQAEEVRNYEEKLNLIKLAYEVYLEMAYKIHGDSDKAGRHFAGLSDYFLFKGEKRENLFKLCIMKYINIANEYIDELAKLYYDYRQYRYLKLAFEIAKVSGEYGQYLRKFAKAFVQWEMVQLVKNIIYLLQQGEYNTAQEFYSYCVEHVNHVPKILELTNDIIEGLLTERKSVYQNILNLLKIYPKVHKTYYIVHSMDKDAMSDQIFALEFINKFYNGGMEYTGELDCSSVNYALYLQYQQLYSLTKSQDYLEKMYNALELSSMGVGNVPHKYKLITLCYRYGELNKDVSSIIERMHLSSELFEKIKEYQLQLEELKNTYLEQYSKIFYELCDLSLFYSPKNSITNIKNFIKNHILSDEIEMNEALRDYLMSFDIIGKAWLQLYFEESMEQSGGIYSSFSDYTNGFESINHVIRILENSNQCNKTLMNIELLKDCVYNSEDMDSYITLVQEFLRDDGMYSYEGLELLHHFFAIMTRDERLSLYKVLDAINNNSQYKNTQCTDLLYQLYKKIKDISNLKYLTALARQYAKAHRYKEAEECYRELLNQASNNTNLAKQYEYIKPHLITMSILVLANNNEKIQVSKLTGMKANLIYKVLSYLSFKYPDEVSKVMELLDEEERILLLYIKQLIDFERQKFDDYKSNDASIDSKDVITEEKLFETLLLLKDSRHFSNLLPNLYQASIDAEFKYFLAGYKDKKIQSVLKENNNKEILVLAGQQMNHGEKLMLMD